MNSQKMIRLSSDLEIDAVEFASRANAILGIRDSGKTFTATRIAEQLLACGIPFFAFDPIGRWRFLRMPGKGKDACGFPVVVAGGMAPDLELTPENATQIVRAAMQCGISLVIDLYSIGMSKAKWRAIVRACIEVMLYENASHGLRHVFLEEAAEFIPQHVRDGLTYAEVEKLARMGGNVGLGITLVNQRAEEVNKAVLELCDNLLLHRQRGKNSIKSLHKWFDSANIKPPRDITDTLADLPTGECWAWLKDHGAPQRIKILPKRSMDPDRRALSSPAQVGITAQVAVDVGRFVSQMKTALAGKPVKPLAPPVLPPAAAPKTIPPKSASAPKEKQVDEKEAAALRAENSNLKAQVADLRRDISDLKSNTNKPAYAPTESIDLDTAARAVIERVLADPRIIAVSESKPEIDIVVTREKIEVDGTTPKGRIIRLLASGFYDDGKAQGATRYELKRTGPDVNPGTISKVVSGLVASGFLTLESGGNYRAVSGMKVNIIDR